MRKRNQRLNRNSCLPTFHRERFGFGFAPGSSRIARDQRWWVRDEHLERGIQDFSDIRDEDEL